MNNRILVTVLVFAGILAAAAADHFGRIAVYAGPLYFVPLVFAGWYLSRGGAITAALFAAFMWAMVSLEAGSPYFEPASWMLNLLMQGALFLLVTMLARWLRSHRDTARELSSVDEDTGLASRHGFFERAGSVLAVGHRNGEPATLAYLTFMGTADDTHTLRALGEILADTLRISDVAGRVGEREFMMLLPETGQAAARIALEKVHHAVEQQNLAVHIGAVTASPAPRDLNRMFKAAGGLLNRLRSSRKDEVLIEGMPAPA